MSEEVAEVLEDDAPQQGIASWAAMIHLRKIEEVIRDLTPTPWAVHPDPDKPGSFYISGPPDTRVVAEGLTQEDATSILYLINELPETIEYFEDLAKLWDVLNDGAIESKAGELNVYLDIIAKYQTHIAQLEANPAPIPEVSTAKDLSFMHVGHMITVGEAEMGIPIVSVDQRNESFAIVTAGYDNNIVFYLPKDQPVTVTIVGSLAQWLPEEEAEEAEATPLA